VLVAASIPRCVEFPDSSSFGAALGARVCRSLDFGLAGGVLASSVVGQSEVAGWGSIAAL